MAKYATGKGPKVPPPSGFWLRAFLTAAVLLPLGGCLMESQTASPPQESRIFNVLRVDTPRYESVAALKLAEGARCIVFAPVNGQISAGTARSIAAEYDARIYPKITGAFGDYAARGYDVDGNGKIILFLVDIQDGYAGKGGYVAGYFDSNHLLDTSGSNRADMLFIDINPQVPGSQGFYSTIAHELQHLINFAMHGGQSQEIWLNEGLSSAAEYLYGGPQEDRVKYFNVDPMETIARGNNFFVWNGYWEKNYGDSLANYATAYLFFQWLRIQAGGTVYSAISNSTYRDYQAVTQAVKGWIPGITETNDAAIIWDQLLSSWMIANVIKAQTGLYGYKGEIDVQVKMSTDVNKYVQFFPGEGRYSSLKSTSFTNDKGSGSNIKYRGITKQSSGITDSSPYTGDVLLTYNANPQPSGSDESGFVMDYLPAPSSLVSASAGTARLAISSGELPSSYPIGAHDLWAQGSAGGAGPQPVQ